MRIGILRDFRRARVGVWLLVIRKYPSKLGIVAIDIVLSLAISRPLSIKRMVLATLEASSFRRQVRLSYAGRSVGGKFSSIEGEA